MAGQSRVARAVDRNGGAGPQWSRQAPRATQGVVLIRREGGEPRLTQVELADSSRCKGGELGCGGSCLCVFPPFLSSGGVLTPPLAFAEGRWCEPRKRET